MLIVPRHEQIKLSRACKWKGSKDRWTTLSSKNLDHRPLTNVKEQLIFTGLAKLLRQLPVMAFAVNICLLSCKAFAAIALGYARFNCGVGLKTRTFAEIVFTGLAKLLR